MSLDTIALWNLAATVPSGFVLFLLLRGRRRRRLAAEKKRRALAALAAEERRFALEWQKRERARARAAEIARRPAPMYAALQAAHLDGARKALASVRELAPEPAASQAPPASLEEEAIANTAGPPRNAVAIPSRPAEPSAAATDGAREPEDREAIGNTARPRHNSVAIPSRPAEATAAPIEDDEDREGHPVRFQALWHGSMKRAEWRPLLVYMYSGWNGFSAARADFRRRIEAPVDHDSEAAATPVEGHGVPITVIPELQGFVFDPPAARILWLEQWRRVEFRMRASESRSVPDRAQPVGRIAFFVGPLLVAETAIAVRVLEDTSDAGLVARPSTGRSGFKPSWKEKSSPPYRDIFLSYSHEDSVIVNGLEDVKRAIGDSFLRDVTILRSGEERNSVLLGKISRADVFQLWWSHAAKNSPRVEREWRCALALERRGYIRPMCFEQPMPEPPEELQGLRFSFVDMST